MTTQSTRIDTKLLDKVRKLAVKEKRSIKQQIELILDWFFNN